MVTSTRARKTVAVLAAFQSGYNELQYTKTLGKTATTQRKGRVGAMAARRRVKVRAPLKHTCELVDDVDEVASTGLGVEDAADEGEDTKENRSRNRTATGVKTKRSKSLYQSDVAGSERAAPKRQQNRTSAALKSSSVRSLQQPAALVNAARQESPPAFAFRQGKTRFRKRKLVQREQQQQRSEANEKRIRELIAYFTRLDEQIIEVE